MTQDSRRPRGTSEVWDAADLVTPMAVRVAATLHLADHIGEAAAPLPLLAERTGTQPRLLKRLLDHLVNADVLTEPEPGAYGLTATGEQLRGDFPGCPRDWLDISGAFGRGDLALVHLLETVRTGKPGYEAAYGRTFWEDLDADPALSGSFDTLLSSLLVPGETKAAADGYDWGALGHLVDVGGGDATLLAALLTAHPELRGTLVELPKPAAAGRERLAAEGLADRSAVVESSFLDPLPEEAHGAGGYLLSVVLHDWDDHHTLAILRRCAEAARPGSRVLLIEGLRDDPQGARVRTGMDLRMLTYFAGHERTRDEFAELADRAGLDMGVVRKLTFYRSLVELVVR
ncbi:methyltransferase [Streptomyces sp. NPDC048172]|uniref:methyltransferase n=1 Tax=Streptomyces sp. NPDC048172 TaxID=3365505 RepID=UPI00372088F5